MYEDGAGRAVQPKVGKCVDPLSKETSYRPPSQGQLMLFLMFLKCVKIWNYTVTLEGYSSLQLYNLNKCKTNLQIKYNIYKQTKFKSAALI